MTYSKLHRDRELTWSGKRSFPKTLEVGRLSAVLSASAALLCGTLAQYLSSKQAEIYSEIICWALLPALFHIIKTEDSPRTITPFNSAIKPPVSWRSLWIVAVGLALTSVYRAELGIVKLYPLLTPILLICQQHVLSLPKPNDSKILFDLSNVWAALSIALIAILPTMEWNILSLALTCIPMLALLTVFVALMSKTTRPARFIPDLDFRTAFIGLSWRVLILLVLSCGLQSYIFELQRAALLPTLILGLFKSLFWLFAARAAESTSWCIATSVGAFAILSTTNPFTQSSEISTISQVIASILYLVQVVQMSPRQAKYRMSIMMLALIPIIAYLAHITARQSAISSASWSIEGGQRHPVDALISDAQAKFSDLVHKQSRTYEAARKSYQRRYNMEPPPGFGTWFEYALSHQSPIIDDFDMMYDTISPFWKLSGTEVVDNIRDTERFPGVDTWSCSLTSQGNRSECTHPWRTNDRSINLLFKTLLQPLPLNVPAVTFLVNHLDEPRVVLPSSRGETNRHVSLKDITNQNIWDTITASCDDDTPKRGRPLNSSTETYGLPFITSHQSSYNLCKHSEYRTMHGLIMSPTSFKLIEGVVPILSTGTLSTMGDLLYPSAAYMEPPFRYDSMKDIPWDQKHNQLYWTGSTNGAYTNTDQWPHYHRQRFVTLIQQLEHRTYHYLHLKDNLITRTASTFLNSHLYNVAFTNIIGCTRKYWHQQHQFFNLKSWADKDEAFKSKLVFDLDGNGISGRYYKLLASNSVPLKQTILSEWHDDRLVPWVHYVPVSLGMEELPELVMYLTSTEMGQQRAREIAEQGKEWFRKAMRVEDRSVYVYRLLLELARLQDPERMAMV